MAWPRKAATLLASLAAISGVASGTGDASGAAVRPQLVTIGAKASIPSHATRLGALAPTARVHVDLLLAPRHPSELASLATAISTPGSARYGDDLTPSEVAQRFGATNASLSSLRAKARREGLAVSAVRANRLVVELSGAASSVESALHTKLVDYRLANGTVAFANTEAPRVARALGQRVEAVAGLDELNASTPTGLELDADATSPAKSASTTSATTGPAPSATCATQMSEAEEPSSGFPGSYGSTPSTFDTASDLASAYGFDSLYASGDLGAGSTIALIEFAPFIAGDISAFQACYGTSTTVNTYAVDGGSGAAVTGGFGANVGGQEEAELDIEDIIGLAPEATIDVYEAPQQATDANMIDAFSAAISNPKVKVISTSWGSCEAETDSSLVTSESTLFEEAAAEGKTVVAAAGDSGSADCYGTGRGPAEDALAVDDPASQPYVTGVGGTTFASVSTSVGETVWNADGGAGGGGVSTIWPMPSYQSDAPADLHVVNTYSACSPSSTPGSGDCREVPDVAADAGTPVGFYCTESGQQGCSPEGWTAFGGTSVAAPIWAALFALADASPSCAAHPIGFANPALYAVAGSSSYHDDFTDVTTGNNDLGFNGGLYPAGVGYDLASGLGSPIADSSSGTGLVAGLCGASQASIAPTLSGLRPAAGPLAGGEHVAVIGSHLSGATAVSFGSSAATSFRVVSSSEVDAVAPVGHGTVDVHVTTASGKSPTTTKAAFAYLVAPKVTALSPSKGPRGGGTTVAVTGSGFVDVTAVHIGTKRATSFEVRSSTRLLANVPAGTGKAAVRVTTRGGTSTARSTAVYAYQSS